MNATGTTGVAAVGSSWALAVRATRFVLRFALFGFVIYARVWWRLLRADNLHDHGMIRRRRAWLLLWTPSTLLVFAAMAPGLGPFLARQVGLVPLGAVALAAIVSTVGMRRQGRHARRPATAVAASAAVPALDLGEWADVNPRTQAAERAIGDLLWKMSESGMSTTDALRLVATLPAFSQTVVLFVAESTLARFSQQGADGHLVDDPGAVEVMVWFFDLTAKLRHWLGGGPSLAVTEPALRPKARR